MQQTGNKKVSQLTVQIEHNGSPSALHFKSPQLRDHVQFKGRCPLTFFSSTSGNVQHCSLSDKMNVGKKIHDLHQLVRVKCIVKVS